MNIENRTTWEVRVGVHTTREQAEDLRNRIEANLLEQIDTGVLRPGTLRQAARAAGYALYACELTA